MEGIRIPVKIQLVNRQRAVKVNRAVLGRLVRALAQEIHEDWIEDNRYLNMAPLKEHKKAQARVPAAA